MNYLLPWFKPQDLMASIIIWVTYMLFLSYALPDQTIYIYQHNYIYICWLVYCSTHVMVLIYYSSPNQTWLMICFSFESKGHFHSWTHIAYVGMVWLTDSHYAYVGMAHWLSLSFCEDEDEGRGRTGQMTKQRRRRRDEEERVWGFKK